MANPLTPQIMDLFGARRVQLLCDAGLMALDGEKLIKRAHEWGHPILYLLISERVRAAQQSFLSEISSQVSLATLGENQIQQLVGYRVHQGMIGLAARPRSTELHHLPDRLLLLNGIDNAENVGSILRNAWAFGFAVIADGGSCSPLVRRSVRVSMGAAMRVPIVESNLPATAIIPELRDLGYTILATGDRDDAKSPLGFRFPQRGCLIIGNEDAGVAGPLIEASDMNLRLQIATDCDSLNAATAAAILMAYWADA